MALLKDIKAYINVNLALLEDIKVKDNLASLKDIKAEMKDIKAYIKDNSALLKKIKA